MVIMFGPLQLTDICSTWEDAVDVKNPNPRFQAAEMMQPALAKRGIGLHRISQKGEAASLRDFYILPIPQAYQVFPFHLCVFIHTLSLPPHRVFHHI